MTMRTALALLALLAGCAGRFPDNKDLVTLTLFLGARFSAPRYAYISSPGTNQVFSYSVDSLGLLTATGSLTQATAPGMLTPDPAGRYLHFQTSAGAALHWRALNSAGVPTTGGSLGTTSSAILVRSVAYPSYMIGLVQGGGSSLQSYPLSSDGSITAPATGMETGTNYSAMTQHPTLPIVYILENAGASIHVSQFSSNGIFSFRASVASTAASSIAVDPLGRFLLVANANAASNLSYYSLDPAGVPTFVQSMTAGPAAPAHLAIEPLGRYAYVARQTSGSNLITVKTSPFEAQNTNSTGHTPGAALTSLLVDNSGRFLYSAGGTPNGVALFYLPAIVGGAPTAAAFYSTPAAATIGLYHTMRCGAFPDLDC